MYGLSLPIPGCQRRECLVLLASFCLTRYSSLLFLLLFLGGCGLCNKTLCLKKGSRRRRRLCHEKSMSTVYYRDRPAPQRVGQREYEESMKIQTPLCRMGLKTVAGLCMQSKLNLKTQTRILMDFGLSFGIKIGRFCLL
jgi:hypothetical protein